MCINSQIKIWKLKMLPRVIEGLLLLLGVGVLPGTIAHSEDSPFFDHATRECTAPVFHPSLGAHKQTVLVTGAGGFIASHVARHCANYGMTVIAVDDLSGGFTANIPGGVTVSVDGRGPI
jgi:phosphoglycerate dehydrogenase-like enzyme